MNPKKELLWSLWVVTAKPRPKRSRKLPARKDSEPKLSHVKPYQKAERVEELSLKP